MVTTATPIIIRPSFDEIICRQIAAAVYSNVIKYLGIALAFPIHVLIVLLLFLRVTKRRFYHYLIIAQSLVDIAGLACLFITHSVSFRSNTVT